MAKVKESLDHANLICSANINQMLPLSCKKGRCGCRSHVKNDV